MELISNKVKLRDFKISDLDSLSEILTDMQVAELAGFKVKENIVEVLYTLSKFVNTNEKNMVWGITLTGEENVIGWIELHYLLDSGDATWEIGFVLNKKYWGQGIMRDAITQVQGFAFGKLKVENILCSHFKNNRRSEKTIKASGFEYLKEDEKRITYIIKNKVA